MRGVPCLARAALIAALVALGSAYAAGAEQHGLTVPKGFRVEVVADESLANDTYAMTLDARGRVVVTTRGEVKTLHDDNGDGKADRAVRYAETPTGGMGLCFDGPDLLFCGDGWLSRFRDADGDGRADGPPERLLPLAFAEHGGHAMRKGPDGSWYVIGGNDSGIGPRHATAAHSPIRTPEAGCLLRLSPDGKRSEIIAEGFRNPYDFDFNPLGDLFTYDSDVERDVFLPWYSPTRLYQVGYGGHHGWRLTGYQRSWPRPGDDPGTVDVLASIGRGSPTGVVCYRHTQFPARFRGGLFFLDWTFGKVFFTTLTPAGASYRANVEVFLAPVGSDGFAPTDAVVAPDGSLLVSIGGRKTRGAVYRISYEGPGTDAAAIRPRDDLEAVLRAPQPLDAWSRARWEPIADRLGRSVFLAAVRDENRPAAERIRAVEVLTERFAGLTRDAADATLASADAPLRARIAWSLGRRPVDSGELLDPLTNDADAAVRREALDALSDTHDRSASALAVRAVRRNLGHADKRVRLAAVRLETTLSPAERIDVGKSDGSADQAVLSHELALILRASGRPYDVSRLLVVLRRTADPDLRFQAVRLIQRALGDFNLHGPRVEIETGYSLPRASTGVEGLGADSLRTVRTLFPSGDARLDEESARLLAMLNDDDPATPAKVASFWTATSSPTRDLHFLIVFARLRGPRDAGLTERVARAVVALDRKLKGQEQRIKQSWNARVTELVGLLQERDPRLAEALLKEPDFVAPNHVALALGLPAERRRVAARMFLNPARKDADFVWSGPLIELLGQLPVTEVRPALREAWSNLALRDALLPLLADPPDAADRPRYLDALNSGQTEIVRAALGALESLPPDGTPEQLLPLARLIRRTAREPKEQPLMGRALALLQRQSGQRFDATGGRVVESVLAWFTRTYPALSARLADGGDDPAVWLRRLKTVDWSQGDPKRGARLFQERGCQTCHDGPRALGPDLAGVTNRLARDDLFTAIVAPNLDVSPLYRTTLVETRQGTIYSGTVAFESADGLILQTGATTTVRVANDDIATRAPGTRSLMPEQLLQGLSDPDLADLDAYLRSLSNGGPVRSSRR